MEHPARSTRLQRIARMRAGDWAMTFEAIFWLIVARIGILVVPFRRLGWFYGRPLKDDPEPTWTADQVVLATRVGNAVSRAARFAPLPLVCLPQAMAARVMLRRRGITCLFYLGVARDGEAALKAHAWTRTGAKIVTGGPQHREFKPVATFL